MRIAEVISIPDAKTYVATLRLRVGDKFFLVTTNATADSAVSAFRLLSSVYGRSNVVDVKELLDEAASAKPPTPEQLKVQSLQRAKDTADAALKAERSRQKVARAQRALQRARAAQAA